MNVSLQSPATGVASRKKSKPTMMKSHTKSWRRLACVFSSIVVLFLTGTVVLLAQLTSSSSGATLDSLMAVANAAVGIEDALAGSDEYVGDLSSSVGLIITEEEHSASSSTGAAYYQQGRRRYRRIKPKLLNSDGFLASLTSNNSYYRDPNQVSHKDHSEHGQMTSTAADAVSSKIQEELQPSATNVPSFDESVQRSDRFPSLDERVRVYAGNWYDPPCDEQSKFPVLVLEQYMTNPRHQRKDASRPYSQQGSSSSSSSPSYVVRVQIMHPAPQGGSEELLETELSNYLTLNQIFVWTYDVATDLCMSAKEEAEKFLPWKQLMRAKQEREGRKVKAIKKISEFPASLRGRFDLSSGSALGVYCKDTKTTWSKLPFEIEMDPNLPLLVQFGDTPFSRGANGKVMEGFPYFSKFRSTSSAVIPTDDLNNHNATGTRTDPSSSSSCQSHDHRVPLTTYHFNASLRDHERRMQPMIWKLGTDRHYGFLSAVIEFDVPWHLKIPMAIFRGELTADRAMLEQKPFGGKYYKRPNDSDYDRCQRMPRCKLVLDYAEHPQPWIDAKLSLVRKGIIRFPQSVQPSNVNLMSPFVKVRDLLNFKIILLLDGHNVPAGLSWALLSQSVVLMPRPRYTSWLMEELLVPWKHYVPLDDGEHLTDLPQKVQWILTHDEEAHQIAQHGTQWMIDLWYHPDTEDEEEYIMKELLKRYMQHFHMV